MNKPVPEPLNVWMMKCCGAEKRMEEERQEKVDAIRSQADDNIAAMRDAQQALEDELNERQNTEIEAVMKQAQSIQQQIEFDTGKVTKETIVFDNGDDEEEIIAKEGDILNNSHLKALNGLVEARLNEIKANIEEELSRGQGSD